MIKSAADFVALRTSDNPEEYRRAAHDTASYDVWVQVITDYPAMRKWVAHNKTVPADILRILAADTSVEVRVTVAAVRRLDAAMFEALAYDSDASVRQRVAFNAKTPHHVLLRLQDDPAQGVRESATHRLKLRR